jgi:hypothetical protein
MKNPPCIRGLKEFKKGCPQQPWNGVSGCPAWVELLVTPEGAPLKPKDKIGKCIDHWDIELRLKALGLLEGNQRATESFRNNMSTDRGPRPDPALLKMINMIETNKPAQIGND